MQVGVGNERMVDSCSEASVEVGWLEGGGVVTVRLFDLSLSLSLSLSFSLSLSMFVCIHLRCICEIASSPPLGTGPHRRPGRVTWMMGRSGQSLGVKEYLVKAKIGLDKILFYFEAFVRINHPFIAPPPPALPTWLQDYCKTIARYSNPPRPPVIMLYTIQYCA